MSAAKTRQSYCSRRRRRRVDDAVPTVAMVTSVRPSVSNRVRPLSECSGNGKQNQPPLRRRYRPDWGLFKRQQ